MLLAQGFASVPEAVIPALIWGIESGDGRTTLIGDEALSGAMPPARFRWLHMNLADERTRRWIADAAFLPELVRELMLSADDHQRAVVDRDVLGCVVHDLERDFDDRQVQGIGALRFALGPTMLVTARRHPLRSADLVRQRLRTLPSLDAGAALDLLIGSIAEIVSGVVGELSGVVQTAEDALLDDGAQPDGREMIGVRREAVRLHRLLAGLNAVFLRLEEDEALPRALLPVVEKIVQRLGGIDADVAALQSQLRLVREEMDLEQAKRTNQNLYVLSILSALMLPATLVTGIFGMNTGGLPWHDTPYGTLIATTLVGGSAFAVYLLLRRLGLVRQ